MTNIIVPELGESVVEARVAKWLKKEGDAVAIGEALVELETEKIDLEVSADRAGVLAVDQAREGADVKVGEVLAVLDASDGAAAAAAPATASAPAKAARSRRAEASRTGRAGASAASGQARHADRHATSRARPGVELGSPSRRRAPSGRVMKDDVLKAARQRAAPAVLRRLPQPSAPPVARPQRTAGIDRRPTRGRASACRKRRATIARRLVEAQHNAAMLTTFNEVDMSAVMDLRERRKEVVPEAVRRRPRHRLVLRQGRDRRAASAFPQINAEIQGDEIVLKHYYDIGMAVGAEGGLVVPVIRDADRAIVRRHRAVDSRFRQARAGGIADARGSEGRHLHDHQRRRLRIADEHADPQPAAGRHPRAAQDRGSRRWR